MGAGASLATGVLAGGFTLAFVFGYLANRTHFCTMGAISDVVNMEHWGRVRIWWLAIAVAIGSFIAVAGIVAGAVATMKWQQR